MQINDVYKSLGKSILDEYEDELSVFIGKAMNSYLSAEKLAVSNNIDIVDVIRDYLDKKLFYVDIGDMPKEKAQEIIDSLVKKVQEEQFFKIKLNSYADKIAQQEKSKSVAYEEATDSKQSHGHGVLHFGTSGPKFAETVMVKPTYDIHGILNSNKTYVNQSDEIKKFVEDSWYSKERLNDEFNDLPKLGDENPVELYSSIAKLEDDQQNSGNVDL